MRIKTVVQVSNSIFQYNKRKHSYRMSSLVLLPFEKLISYFFQIYLSSTGFKLDMLKHGQSDISNEFQIQQEDFPALPKTTSK